MCESSERWWVTRSGVKACTFDSCPCIKLAFELGAYLCTWASGCGHRRWDDFLDRGKLGASNCPRARKRPFTGTVTVESSVWVCASESCGLDSGHTNMVRNTQCIIRLCQNNTKGWHMLHVDHVLDNLNDRHARNNVINSCFSLWKCLFLELPTAVS